MERGKEFVNICFYSYKYLLDSENKFSCIQKKKIYRHFYKFNYLVDICYSLFINSFRVKKL